jgi:hypothetical protein
MKALTLAIFIVASFLARGTALAEQRVGGPGAKPLRMGQADANTFVGIISDSFCGARHKLPDKSAEECTRTCQRKDAKYVLVAGEKIYELNGHNNDLGYLAGQKVRVTGTLQRNTIEVSSVNATE